MFLKACPVFVPLVEEGWWENHIVQSVSKEYLTPLKRKDIDTLILGCTHYPILYNTIKNVIGENVACINSAYEVAKFVKKELEICKIASDKLSNPIHQYFTSDNTNKFKSLARKVLKRDIYYVRRVDIEKY